MLKPVRKEDEAAIVRRMLELGYQVELDALTKVLEQEGNVEGALKVLDMAIKSKAQAKGRRYVITFQDVRPFVRFDNDLRDENQMVSFDYVILRDPTKFIGPYAEAVGYIHLFKNRYDKMMEIVRTRPDFYQIERLGNIKGSLGGRKVSAKVAGFVVSKKIGTDFGAVTLEDDSGYMRVMCAGDIRRKLEEFLLDEMVLAEVESLPKGYYAKGLSHLDIPERAKNLCPAEVCVMFLSDLCLGTPDFDSQAFERLLGWLNGDFGELDIVSKVKYVVLNGGLIDDPMGRGDLRESEIESHYDRLADYIGKIKRAVRVFVLPGESDATRRALPQPAVLRKYAKRLYGMNNVIMLGNPSVIQLHGVNVLLFHGQSLDGVMAQLGSRGPMKPSVGIRALLRARHLAPTYGQGVPIAPEREDLLVVDEVPDIVHCGHLGKPDDDMYRGTLMISTPKWIRVNHGVEGESGKAALVDLSTFQVLWRP